MACLVRAARVRVVVGHEVCGATLNLVCARTEATIHRVRPARKKFGKKCDMGALGAARAGYADGLPFGAPLRMMRLADAGRSRRGPGGAG